MRLLTLNIWNYTPPWAERRDRIVALIRETQPDVVCLQETRHDFRREGGRGQGELLAELTGYYPIVAVAQVYLPLLRIDEGLTTLTRDQPLEHETRELTRLSHERQDENRRICLRVRIENAGNPVDVYNSHFSLSPVAQVSNARDVLRFVEERSRNVAAVLSGDLNAEPHAAPLRLLCGEGGDGAFEDAWTLLRPSDQGCTYASWDPVRRIDYVLTRRLRPTAIELVRHAADGASVLSDHLGLLMEADFQTKGSSSPERCPVMADAEAPGVEMPPYNPAFA